MFAEYCAIFQRIQFLLDYNCFHGVRLVTSKNDIFHYELVIKENDLGAILCARLLRTLFARPKD